MYDALIVRMYGHAEIKRIAAAECDRLYPGGILIECGGRYVQRYRVTDRYMAVAVRQCGREATAPPVDIKRQGHITEAVRAAFPVEKEVQDVNCAVYVRDTAIPIIIKAKII